jgi:pyruvate,water dikinase
VSCFNDRLVAWFGEIDRKDVAAGGGKGASLSDMARAGLPVPPGFVVCTEAFRQFLQLGALDVKIADTLDRLDVENGSLLELTAKGLVEQIESAECPVHLKNEILSAYHRMCEEYGGLAVVAVRSSAAAEDSQAASFAGQQETYLNIYGDENVVQKVKACWGSFFQSRAIFYRQLRGSLKDTSIAVVIQRMVNPEKSGVLFTVDPVQRRRDRVMIEAAWGLGESVVSGLVTPDNYVVNKSDGRLVSKFISKKSVMIVREETGIGCRHVDLPHEKAQAQVLSPEELEELLSIGKLIESHFGSAQDVEWAIEGDHLYVLQSRPVTTM